jgi:hypothetical protein
MSLQTVYGLKISIFWDITPCSPFKFNRCSEELATSISRVRKISQAGNHLEAGDMFLRNVG